MLLANFGSTVSHDSQAFGTLFDPTEYARRLVIGSLQVRCRCHSAMVNSERRPRRLVDRSLPCVFKLFTRQTSFDVAIAEFLIIGARAVTERRFSINSILLDIFALRFLRLKSVSEREDIVRR